MYFRKVISFLVILILSGCAVPFEYVESESSPEYLKVQLSPSLEWIKEDMFTCTTENLDIGLSLDERYLFTDNGFDIQIGLGENFLKAETIYQIGQDELNIVVNDQNEFYLSNIETIQAIFTGEIQTWQDAAGLSNSIDGTINLWILPVNSDIGEIFETQVMEGLQISEHAFLAPDPAKMLLEIQNDPNAVGYLLSRRIDSGIHAVMMESFPSGSLTMPFLAAVQNPDDEMVKNFLHCLQEQLNQ